ncbi:hypothetical protein IFVP182_C290210 [Vibrio parahaemolyticus]
MKIKDTYTPVTILPNICQVAKNYEYLVV